MGDAPDQFVVAIKRSAVAASGTLRAAAGAGDRLTYPDRAAAEAAAERLSEPDGRVAVQRAAPADPSDADAYLVAAPDRPEPEGSLDSGRTYPVTGNQYGALGEALVLSRRVDPPGIARYVRRDLAGEGENPPAAEGAPATAEGDPVAADDADVRVVLDDDPDPVVLRTGAGERSWVPDCVARARAGGRTVRSYRCELKTGDASFGRAQRTVMAHAARAGPVLVVRIAIEDLPDSYTVRIRREDPVADPEGELVAGSGRDARLSEF